MPTLAPPTVLVHASFAEAMEEFRTEPDLRPSSAVGRTLQELGPALHDPAAFAAYVARLDRDAQQSAALPEGWVPATTLWYLDGATFLGRLSIRHRLTPSLLEEGGHIGYEVRPSARRRGYATAMLREALPKAAALGLRDVLVTCDHDNLASKRVIEANGGTLEDRRGDKLRYWMPTSQG